MKFRPLDKRVLLERVEEETKTSSGIIIPDNAKEKPLVGVVRAISKKLEKERYLVLDHYLSKRAQFFC